MPTKKAAKDHKANTYMLHSNPVNETVLLHDIIGAEHKQSSKYNCVYWDRCNNTYKTLIKTTTKRRTVGYYQNEKIAAMAVDDFIATFIPYDGEDCRNGEYDQMFNFGHPQDPATKDKRLAVMPNYAEILNKKRAEKYSSGQKRTISEYHGVFSNYGSSKKYIVAFTLKSKKKYGGSHESEIDAAFIADNLRGEEIQYEESCPREKYIKEFKFNFCHPHDPEAAKIRQQAKESEKSAVAKESKSLNTESAAPAYTAAKTDDLDSLLGCVNTEFFEILELFPDMSPPSSPLIFRQLSESPKPTHSSSSSLKRPRYE